MSAALPAAVLAALTLASARPASPAEVAVFVSGATPGGRWGTGYGGMLTITLFNIVGAEVEGAKQGSELGDTSLYSLSGKAYVGPSFGRLVPYAGLGAGVYLETRPGDDDQGTLGSVFVGAKLKFPFGLVVRAEYQWLDVPEAAPVPLDERYFVAVGLSF